MHLCRNLVKALAARRPEPSMIDGDGARGLCCVEASHGGGEGGLMKRTRRPRPPVSMP
jgi:hypothetical protein